MSCRGERSARRLALLLCTAAACAQQAPQAQQIPPDEPRRELPSGLRLNSVSVFGEADWLGVPSASDGPRNPTLWLFSGGSIGDVSLLFGRQTQFSAGYRGGYSYNHRYPQLNGSHHTVSLELRTDPARRTIFSFGASAESGLVSDAVFDPSYALSLTQQSLPADQLVHGLQNATTDSLLDSPVELALAGGRRKSGAAYAGFTHFHSRRFSTYFRAGAAREIHSYPQDQPATAAYPNVTVATADLGVIYSVSTRTRISADSSYTRSYSRQYRADWQSGGLGIDRQFGRSSFGALQAGYVRISDPATRGFGRSSYTIAGAVGTSPGYHTLALRVRRGVSDSHGLRADASIGADGAWDWNPHAIPWRLSSSLGYERVEGGTLGLLQAWIAQATAARRLGRHFELALTAVYINHSVPGLIGPERRGLRISLVWTPGTDRRR